MASIQGDKEEDVKINVAMAVLMTYQKEIFGPTARTEVRTNYLTNPKPESPKNASSSSTIPENHGNLKVA